MLKIQPLSWERACRPYKVPPYKVEFDLEYEPLKVLRFSAVVIFYKGILKIIRIQSGTQKYIRHTVICHENAGNTHASQHI